MTPSDRVDTVALFVRNEGPVLMHRAAQKVVDPDQEVVLIEHPGHGGTADVASINRVFRFQFHSHTKGMLFELRPVLRKREPRG